MADKIALSSRGIIKRGYLVFDIPCNLQNTVERTYALASEFFSLPDPCRNAHGLQFGCGFLGYGVEYSGAPDYLDRVDIFAASVRTQAQAALLPTTVGRDLHCSLLEVFSHLEVAAEEIILETAALCGVCNTEELRGGVRRWSSVQVSRAIPTQPNQLLYREHEDGHLLTFALANAAGLEIEVGGTYRPAPNGPNAALVMPGELARLLTGGLLEPLSHRVRAHDGSNVRFAIVASIDLDPALCAPWIDGLASHADCSTHVLSNAARFGVPGFPIEESEGSFSTREGQLASTETLTDNSGLWSKSPTMR